MKIKDLETYYQVSKSSIKDVYNIHSLTESGLRFNGNKYLCSIYKQGTKFSLYENEDKTFYSKLEDLIEAIDKYLHNLKFNSENFYPSLRKGVSVNYCIIDYMRNFDFDSHRHNSDTFVYKSKDVFGAENTEINIIIHNLSNYDNDEVNISYNIKSGEWVSIKGIEKNVDVIIQNINNLIYPIFISHITDMLNTFEKIENVNMKSDIKKFKFNINNLDVTVSDFKDNLKNNLQELLKKLE
ncbi:MAG: hypothetical protein M0R46_12725 [Candidatus Muirbacterium halophilum]|nr:hypothetical protein [Candidatus Muirbacterium halophilum]